jgi:hypothetical protein
MLAKVAGFFSNQASQRVAPFELSPGQWQAFGNWFMSYLRLFRCHQQLWMMRNPTAICGFGVDRARAESLLAHQPSVRAALPQHPSTSHCDVPRSAFMVTGHGFIANACQSACLSLFTAPGAASMPASPQSTFHARCHHEHPTCCCMRRRTPAAAGEK